MSVPRLDPHKTALLVVDVQERILPVMHGKTVFTSRTRRLIHGFNALGLPVIATEHYRKTMGALLPALARPLERALTVPKDRFTAMVEPVVNELDQRDIKSVVVCGLEAHVCVMRTCLDLLDNGRVAAVACDAITSRRRSDRDVAIRRMTQAGVLPTTTEAALLEMEADYRSDRYRYLMNVIK